MSAVEHTSEVSSVRPAIHTLDTVALAVIATIAVPATLLLVGHFDRASSFSAATEAVLAGIVLLGVLLLSFRRSVR